MRYIGEIYDYINEICPFNTQEEWDNAGLLVGSGDSQITRAVLSLDITLEVVEEAAQKGAGLIISHHPVIFKAIKRLPASSPVYALARNGITAICAHTNLDMAKGGVNDELFLRLGLCGKRPLSIAKSTPFKQISVYAPSDSAEGIYSAMANAGAGAYQKYSGCAFISHGEGRFVPEQGASPYIGKIGECERADEVKISMIAEPSRVGDIINAMMAAHPYEVPSYEICDNYALKSDIPMGLIGELKEEMTAEQFAAYVKDCLKLQGVKLYGQKDSIKKIGLCSGAGGSLLYDAIASGCDAMVTGDVRHNEALDAAGAGMIIVDAGHFGTENIIIKPLCDRLSQKFSDIEFIIAQSGEMNYKYI